MSRRRARRIAVIGGGPAGLMAAETLAARGHAVDVFDAMPSVGRKFLLAGVGGLNLTHSEAPEHFVSRYRERRPEFERLFAEFGAAELREWAHGLGIETFVGSSGRVFPTGMKAAPLLRAWLHHLRESGVRFHVRHRWLGWHASGTPPTAGLRFATPAGEQRVDAAAVVLALGGASWARLGSDGAWVSWLAARDVTIAQLKPSNRGFDVGTGTREPGGAPGRRGWSEHFRGRFAGQPLKSVALRFPDAQGETHERGGECMVSATGLEGNLIYALSAPLRNTIAAAGAITVFVDLAPGRTLERLTEELSRPRGARSIASHLQGKAGIAGVKAGLLRECAAADDFASPARLAGAIKALPVTLVSPRPLDEAISTAGGVAFEDLDERLMIRNLPGVFCCGEMLDWEAPTGGYLLTGCFASARAAGLGASTWMESGPERGGGDR
jgi:uncharacterized flavoprotein (TIGR03862 family)